MVLVKNNAEFISVCSFSNEEMQRMASGTLIQRQEVCKAVSKVSTEEATKLESMTFLEQLACILVLAFGVPAGVFSIPLLCLAVGMLLGNISGSFQALALILIPLAIIPQPFLPSTLKSRMATLILKYFSFRFIMEERPPTMSQTTTPSLRPRILVAPPHGVFPYGNILAMLTWPLLTGHHFQGLAANAALRVPIFKQLLRSIGVVDASRKTARQALENFPFTIGISTGGVAEVFETNEHDECVRLKERVGLIKLAISTGADLVPCYLFGNTKLLSCWAGEGIPGGRERLEKISRKFGFALIFFYGRFFLPIPYRRPVLGVCGKPIRTFHMMSERPTKEQIEEIQQKLIKEMEELFDKYKGLYGWSDKRLVIK